MIVIRLSAVNLVLALLVSVGTAVADELPPLRHLRRHVRDVRYPRRVGAAAIVLLGFGIVAITCSHGLARRGPLAVPALRAAADAHCPARCGPEWRAIRREVLSFAGSSDEPHRSHGGGPDEPTSHRHRRWYGRRRVLPSAERAVAQVTGLLTKVAQVLIPTGSALIARGDLDGLQALTTAASAALPRQRHRRLHDRGLRVPFLEYWVSPTLRRAWLCGTGDLRGRPALNSASLAVGFLSWSAAKAGVNLVFALLNSAVSLVAIYPLASRYGVAGAAMAGLLGALVAPFLHSPRRPSHPEVSSWSVFRRCHLPTLVGAGLVALVSSVCSCVWRTVFSAPYPPGSDRATVPCRQRGVRGGQAG